MTELCISDSGQNIDGEKYYYLILLEGVDYDIKSKVLFSEIINPTSGQLNVYETLNSLYQIFNP